MPRLPPVTSATGWVCMRSSQPHHTVGAVSQERSRLLLLPSPPKRGRGAEDRTARVVAIDVAAVCNRTAYPTPEERIYRDVDQPARAAPVRGGRRPAGPDRRRE